VCFLNVWQYREENAMKSPIQIFVACAVLLATATVAAQVYKWVDKDGRIQYSDQPAPPDAKEVKTAPKRAATKAAPGAPAGTAAATAPATTPATTPAKDAPKDATKDATKENKDAKAPPAPPKTLAEANKQSEDRRKAEAEAAKKADDEARRAKQNQERCDSAKSYVTELESGRPIATTKNGERTLVSDEERAKEVARARTAMSESCKK
jgi:Domain of unknown function (DUF4124)